MYFTFHFAPPKTSYVENIREMDHGYHRVGEFFFHGYDYLCLYYLFDYWFHNLLRYYLCAFFFNNFLSPHCIPTDPNTVFL